MLTLLVLLLMVATGQLCRRLLCWRNKLMATALALAKRVLLLAELRPLNLLQSSPSNVIGEVLLRRLLVVVVVIMMMIGVLCTCGRLLLRGLQLDKLVLVAGRLNAAAATGDRVSQTEQLIGLGWMVDDLEVLLLLFVVLVMVMMALVLRFRLQHLVGLILLLQSARLTFAFVEVVVQGLLLLLFLLAAGSLPTV